MGTRFFYMLPDIHGLSSVSLWCVTILTNVLQNQDVPKLYWIPKLHKNPYKQRFIAGSAKCSTNNKCHPK